MFTKGHRHFFLNNDNVPGQRRGYRRYFLNQSASLNMFAYDNFENYSNNSLLNGLNAYTIPSSVGNSNNVYWLGNYVDRTNFQGVRATDTLETYSSGSEIDGLNSGDGWMGSYVDRNSPFNYTIFLDTFEGYSSGSALNGLNGGSGSTQVYVDR